MDSRTGTVHAKAPGGSPPGLSVPIVSMRRRVREKRSGGLPAQAERRQRSEPGAEDGHGARLWHDGIGGERDRCRSVRTVVGKRDDIAEGAVPLQQDQRARGAINPLAAATEVPARDGLEIGLILVPRW